MANSLISITGVSADPLAGFTAAMNFLSTPAGQLVATDLHDVIVDMIKFFHSKNSTTSAFVGPVLTTIAPAPALKP
jgi:hypothetical protein